MLRWPLVVVACISATLLIGSAFGQEPRRPPPTPAARPAGPSDGIPGYWRVLRPSPMQLLSLVRFQQVQQELSLTDDQKTSVRGVARDMFAARRAAGATASDLESALKTRLTAALQAGQMTRLKQIQLRTLGTAAFTNADVVTVLQLTDDQKASLQQIDGETLQALKDLGNPVGTLDSWKAKFASIRKGGMEKALAVLTADQKTAFETLRERKFALTLNLPPPLPPPPPPRHRPGTNSGGTTQ